jgi:hypothetical protein
MVLGRRTNLMQVKLVIFPAENGLNVVVWGKWAKGSMRVRQFENRTEMVQTLRALGLIDELEGQTLESFVFADSCPLFSAEIEELVLAEHGFSVA